MQRIQGSNIVLSYNGMMSSYIRHFLHVYLRWASVVKETWVGHATVLIRLNKQILRIRVSNIEHDGHKKEYIIARYEG